MDADSIYCIFEHLPFFDLITRLTNLICLGLCNNKLESIPLELCLMTNLKELFLNDNNLRLLPIELDQLTRLTILDLYCNKLESIPSELSSLTNLRMLCMDEVISTKKIYDFFGGIVSFVFIQK